MDLFQFLPESTKSAPPPPAPPAPIAAPAAPPPAPRADPQGFPGKPVASFACYCGAQDEVLEPAPETVDCWLCKKSLAMHRWTPPRLPPSFNARQLTEAERARI